MRWSEPAGVPEPAAVVWRRLDLLGDWLDGEGRRWSPQADGSWRAAE